MAQEFKKHVEWRRKYPKQPGDESYEFWMCYQTYPPV